MVFPRRFYWAAWLPAFAFLVLGTPAPRTATAQEPMQAATSTSDFQSPKTSYFLYTAVIRIELNTDNRYGSGLSDDEFNTLVKQQKNIPSVCRSLEKFGKVTVVAQGTIQTRVGQKASLNVTGNIPQLQKHTPSSSSDGGSPTYTQNFYSSGVTGVFDLDDQKGPGTVDLTYHVTLRDVLPKEISLADGASMELMGSTDISWDGLATVPRDNGVFVSHSGEEYQSQSLEYFVVVRVNRNAASPSPGSARPSTK